MNTVDKHSGYLPIGVFDSGVGGLTVAAALRRRLPSEPLLYLGDIARLPYGTKSPETVIRYARQAARFLVARGIKLLVVACNTASAHALTVLEEEFPGLPILGVVEAGARAAAAVSGNGNVVIAATEGTCRSGAFPRIIGQLRPDARVTQQPCPLFVALAEEGMTSGPILDSMARLYLDAHFPAAHSADGGNDTLVLGCTHFPLLAPALAAILGPEVRLVDCGEAVAELAARRLRELGIEAPEAARGSLALIATDAPDRFARMAERLMPSAGGCEVEQVDLQQG